MRTGYLLMMSGGSLLASSGTNPLLNEDYISAYRLLGIVFAVLTVFFAAVSVILFFRLKIPQVYSFLTGRAQRRTIQEMQEKNAQTGTLRDDHYSTLRSDDLYRTHSGQIPPHDADAEPRGVQMEAPPDRGTEQPGDRQQSAEAPQAVQPDAGNAEIPGPQKMQQPAGILPAMQLDPEEVWTETPEKSQGIQIPQSTDQVQDTGSKDAGSYAGTDIAQTLPHRDRGADSGPRTMRLDTAGQTVVLTPQMEEALSADRGRNASRHRFRIVKEQLEVHTDEYI